MAGFKIKASIDTSKLKSILAKKQALIQYNIKTVLKNEAIPHLIRMIMIGYDSLSDRADLLPEDPTNPSNWREEFLTKLQEDLADTFVVTGSKISVKLGDKDFLGYNPDEAIAPGDTQPLHWMVFFLEGLIGDWAFISPDTYQILTGSQYKTTWGRFSSGFMINREEYQNKNWDSKIPFAQVRHPFSGFSPLDIFTEAVREFNIRPYVQKAIDAAVKGRKL